MKKQQRQSLKRQRIQERRGRVEKERAKHTLLMKRLGKVDTREKISIEKAIRTVDRIKPSFWLRVKSYIRAYWSRFLQFLGYKKQFITQQDGTR